MSYKNSRTSSRVSKTLMGALSLTSWLCLGSVNAEGEATTAQLGTVSIAIPTPSGFVEKCSRNPKYSAHMGADIPPENKILACFLSNEDIRKNNTGALISNYLVVQVNTDFMNKPMSHSQFKALRKLLRDTHGPVKGLTKIEGTAKALGAQEVGAESGLGVFEDEYDHISSADLTMIGAHSDAGKPTMQLSTSTIHILKNRIIFIYVFAPYNKVSDYSEAIDFTNQWVKSLRLLNE